MYTVIFEGASALAGNHWGTGDEKALLELLKLTSDVYAPHRALAAACIATVMQVYMRTHSMRTYSFRINLELMKLIGGMYWFE